MHPSERALKYAIIVDLELLPPKTAED